jgi:hypothetical protein
MDSQHNDSSQHNLILKKRLNTCRSSTGRLSNIPDDLVVDIVKAWERWPGTAKSFYSSLGIKKQQMANIIKIGKRLFREGKEMLGSFNPVPTQSSSVTTSNTNKVPIIVSWDKKKNIRFYQVNHLVEFLKKCA